MFTSNNFKLVFRRLLKNKLYLSVNTLSLAIGLLSFLFAFIYIKDELSYDQFHKQADQIYRIEYESVTNDGSTYHFANLHGAVLPEGLNAIPEIELNTRFVRHADLNVDVADKQFEEYNMLAADSNFFTLFSFDFLEGDPATSLNAPNSVVIDKSTAIKYFNTANAIGRTLTIHFQEKESLLSVTGVIEDIPANSHFHSNIVTTAQAYKHLYGFSINEVQMGYNYIKLFEGANPKSVEAKINALPLSNNQGFDLSYHLQKLTHIHLHSSKRGELEVNGNINYLYFLGLITFVVLAIACANFTTLATAQSVERTTEMGVRKVFGALRSNLVLSFFAEGIILSFFGLAIAYLILWEFLPAINSFTGKSFTFSTLVEAPVLLIAFLMVFIIGVVTALYPALILTGKKPASLLLKHSTTGLKGNHLWESVIIIQCTATLVLISVSYIIHQQIDFIQHKDLGFSNEQIITIPNYFGDDVASFLHAIERNPNIVQTTASSYIPGVSKSSGTALVKTDDKSEGFSFDWISVDPNYLNTYEIQLEKGRNFDSKRKSDATRAFIINETAANTLGWENPIGKKLNGLGSEGFVIGVVKDFNFLSLHNKIAPLIMWMNNDYYFSISAKFKSNDQLTETISFIKKTWKRMLPGTVFSYHFVDDQFAAVYKNEQRAQTLFLVFSGLAVFIAILGMFSFATYTIQQKQKEIGIRKVLGATIWNMLTHFYSGYLKFLLIASIIAFPIVYIWMSNWLQNFSYRTHLGMDTLIFPILLTLTAIMISVSYQVIKGALANPVDSIRSD